MTKLEYFDDLWSLGDVYVAVALGHPGVVIPEFIRAKDKATETFVLGLTPTPKLTADEEGIVAPMRFNNIFFDCFFPWDSVFALINEDVQITFRPSEAMMPDTPRKVAPKKIEKKTEKKAEKAPAGDKVVPLRRIK